MVILLKKRGIENSGPALKTSSFDGRGGGSKDCSAGKK